MKRTILALGAAALAFVVVRYSIARMETVPPAPPPRLVAPDQSLILVEEVPNQEGVVDTRRLVRLDFRDGIKRPPKTVWEGDQRFLGHFGGHRLLGDRFLVTRYGGVIDLRTGKVVNSEDNGTVLAIDGTRVIYSIANTLRPQGVFSYDTASGVLKFEHELGKGEYGLPGKHSPDGTKSIEAGSLGDDLILHTLGAKPRSLGKGFVVDLSPLASTFGPSPVFWLDESHVIAQRGNGRLFEVDLDGKQTPLMTIEDAPKALVTSPGFSRDGSGSLIYHCGPISYKLDLAARTWSASLEVDLGHGFAISRDAHEKFGHTIRYDGKEIGQFWCFPYTARATRGFLAVEAHHQQERRQQWDCVAIYSVATKKWVTIDMWPNSLVGWVK